MVLSLAFILSFIGAAVALLIGILVFSEVSEAMAFSLPPVITIPTVFPDLFGFDSNCIANFLPCEPPTIKRFLTTSATGSACPSGTTGSDPFTNQFKRDSVGSGICSAPTFTYDTTTIPDDADVTSILFRINVNEVQGAGENSQIFEVTKDPATMTDTEGTDTVFKRGGAGDFSGTVYLANDDFSTATGTGKIRTLSTTAETDLETALSSGQNFISYAFNFENATRASVSKNVRYGDIPAQFPFDNPKIQINFTTIQDVIVPFTSDEQRELDTFNNAKLIGFTVIGIFPIALFFLLFAIFDTRMGGQFQ